MRPPITRHLVLFATTLLLLPCLSLCRESVVWARFDNDSLADALSRAPSCATKCLEAALADTACSDAQCLCSHEDMEDATTSCVLGACNRPDAFKTKNLTETACARPRRDASTRYDVMNITMGTITTLVVVARIVFKRAFSHRRALSADDWVMLAGIVLGVPTIIVNTLGLTRHGLGRDAWTLPPEELADFVLYFYVMEVLYLTLMAMVKLALSLFYLGIFPGVGIRRLLWGTAAFNVAVGISAVAAAIFQCTPISYYWTQWVADTPGTCIDINLVGWVHGSINVAVDIWLLAIPLSQIRRLELHWKKKVGVAIMFLTGIFATIVSILRFQSLIHFANSLNPTWDQWNVAWWSTIEINIGIICACLPTLRLMLVRLFPRALSSSADYHGGNVTTTTTSSATANTGRGGTVVAPRGILVHQHVRVSTSTIDIALTDDLAKHMSGKSWEIRTQGSSRARSSQTQSVTAEWASEPTEFLDAHTYGRAL
ncbi:hypothetical protein JDV02_009188 [Purpureocillium takamizusanense]|uniref:CFEM domain-containing protein n=1 Tax=Purpureocillium takamizusanense TaxID=2060973 RepID=A0A9Q8QLK5_9HYPO|nr:uncharacterized protein JDV02_009188 [Purpureocillium takamizusanense]UNI23364.1 hypothetical protein JDV02_009188 [Purpureocillium takamizusanense]